MADETLPDDDVDRGLGAAFGRPRPRSVLDSLGAGASRILLREPAADAHTPVMKPVPSGKEGRYQVLGEIARGGVGVVLRGHDVDLGRAVAIKVLRAELADNPTLVQRFVEEAQVGGQLQHPGIVPVYELGVRADGKTPWFAMKLVKGRTLSSLLSDRKQPSDERRTYLAIFEKICQTMAYAHTRGVVHRDLKPANVMVGAFGEVQVVDWGMAKVLHHSDDASAARTPSPPDVSVIATVRSESNSGESEVGSVLGTPAYMPPEQARGAVEQLDERSDVFSLGAVLCEILTGKPPYAGEPGKLLALAAEADLADAHRRLSASGADPDIVKLCVACLFPARDARPRDAGAVAASVASYLASEEEKTRAAQLAAVESRAAATQARAEAEHAKEREGHARRQRRLTAAVAAAVLVTFAVTGGAWVWLEHDRTARAAEVSRDVDAAIAQSAFLQGRTAGRADAESARGAVEAAQRARGMAEEREVAADVRRRAADAVAATEAEALRAADVRKQVRRADRLYEQRKYEEAVAVLRELTDRYPNCAEAHRQLANRMNNSSGTTGFTAIAATYRKAAALDADSIPANSEFAGFLLSSARSPEEALEQTEALVRLDPEDPKWRYWRYLSLLQLGRLDDAARAAAAAAAMLPEYEKLPSDLEELREKLRVVDGLLRGEPLTETWKAKRLELVYACRTTLRFAAMARLWEMPSMELGRSPTPANDHETYMLRYAALRAGLGEGADAADPSDAERARFRAAAVAGYRSRATYSMTYEGTSASGGPVYPCGYTEAELLAKLPPEEHGAWREFFAALARFGRWPSADETKAWALVVKPAQDAAAYRDALATLQNGAAEHPEDLGLRNYLGCALHRTGEFGRACEILREMQTQFEEERGRGVRPVTSAFLAMACWKSGRQDEAREALARAKALAANPIWSSWTYYKDVLREATDLIEGSRAAADAPR